jgi:hypothetical protein
VRRLAILPLIAALALSACGGAETTPQPRVPFPPVQEEGGKAYVPVKSQDEAVQLCVTATTAWPDEYSAYDTVIFKIPGPGANYACERSS